MRKPQNAICSNCGWTDSDALGAVNCPICGAEIIALDSEKIEEKQEKYPTEAVSKSEKDDLEALSNEL